MVFLHLLYQTEIGCLWAYFGGKCFTCKAQLWGVQHTIHIHIHIHNLTDKKRSWTRVWRLSKMLYWWKATDMGRLASLGGILVQHFYTCLYKVHTFQSPLWQGPSAIDQIWERGTTLSSLEEQLMERDAIIDNLKSIIYWGHNKKWILSRTLKEEKWFSRLGILYTWSCNHIDKSLALRPFEKLAARFYGPYEVIQKVGKVAYKLDLPNTPGFPCIPT